MATIKNHPLESVFGMNSGTMTFGLDSSQEVMPYPEPIAPVPITDDAEDEAIAQDISKIFDSAMAAFDNQTELSEIVEPRFAARNAEVANGFLSTALQAVSLKAKIKNEKRKGQTFAPVTSNTTNNVISCDRNTLLEMIRNKKDEEI
jgi:hypothetical protein